jgi:PAS domain-containing protein
MLPAPAGVSAFAAWVAVTTTVLVSGLGIRRVMGRLREMDQRYRSSFADAATGMALVSPDSATSKSTTPSAGSSPARRRPPGHLPDPVDGAAGHPETLEFFAQHARGRRLDRRLLRPDGSVVWGRLTCSPVRDPRGRVLYYVHQVEDITRRAAPSGDRPAGPA